MAPRYESVFDLRGKLVLVAGGGGAIGSEIARAVAAFGAKVAVSGRTARTCDQVAAELAALGSETMALVVDVVDEPSVAREVAGVAVFLASEASSFITGQNITVDGGLTAAQ